MKRKRPIQAGGRTLAHLRKLGYDADPTERFVHIGLDAAAKWMKAVIDAAAELIGRSQELSERQGGGYATELESCIADLRTAVRSQGSDPVSLLTAGFRKDLGGFIDVLACRPALLETPPVTLAVQCTTQQQISNHLRAYRRDPEVRQRILRWIACRNVFVIHGWWREEVDNTSRSGTHTRWRVEERQVTPESLELTPADVAAIAKAKLTSAPAQPKGG